MSPRPRPLNPPYLYSGGTRRLADFVTECVPEYFGQYVEPFLGGGAVAIGLMERFPGAGFRLSSDDAELIVTWQVLATDVDRLVRLIGDHRDRHDRAHRSAVEALDDSSTGGTRLESLSPLERAARFVYLQGSAGSLGGSGSAGGAGRAGSSGRAGRDSREEVAFDQANLRGVSRLLQNRDVSFRRAQPYSIVADVAEEDLVYFDPPFAGKGPEFERETRSLVNTLTARGAYLLAPGGGVAGGAVPYEGWKTMTVIADRGDGEQLWANGTLGRARRRWLGQADS
ncbi:MAG: adenine methylase [Subtercola sp.]|nr:adenine methylase [Subtercola sp.]